MRILAIESSLREARVALLEGPRCLVERELNEPRQTARSLIPTIQELLNEINWRPEEVELVAVAEGPGSFTGLRVGVMTAKTWAYVSRCPLVAVGTLEVLAAQAGPATGIAPIMDAQRQQLFAARYERLSSEPGDPPRLRELQPPAVWDPPAWLASLAPGTVVTGPVVPRWLDPVRPRLSLPAGVTLADPRSWMPRAATVGQLAWTAFQDGRRHDPLTLRPIYIRPSAAQEK